MKTLLYVMIALFMSSSFVACTPESPVQKDALQDTVGEDGNDPDNDSDD